MANSGRLEHGWMVGTASRDRTIEEFAKSQVGRLIDSATPEEERQRRIHRLTEGPPEFVDVRVDLPGRRKD
jgi:hypothetical protein